jgi:scyllo-inositol 2-dehydrogenase (NADP+)
VPVIWFDGRMIHTPEGTQPLRVALLGYGLAGRVFHAPLIRAEPLLRLRAIVTADPERAAQAAADNPGVAVLGSADQVWQSADDYDLVVIATANIVHVEQATAALTAGRHVVVDKPVAPSAEDTMRLVALAHDAGLVLQVFQNRRWDSDFRTLQALRSECGRIHRFESRFERWRPDPRGVWRESADPAAMGGQLLDLGAHLVDQALHLLGPVRTVTAVVRRVRAVDQADDDALVLLEHTAGATSLLSVSAVTAVPGPRFRLLGADGGLVIDLGDTQEDVLRAGGRPGAGPWGREPESRFASVVTRDGERRAPLVDGAWPTFYAGVARAIVYGEPVPVPNAEVIDAMRVLDAARRSDGARVAL